MTLVEAAVGREPPAPGRLAEAGEPRCAQPPDLVGSAFWSLVHSPARVRNRAGAIVRRSGGETGQDQVDRCICMWLCVVRGAVRQGARPSSSIDHHPPIPLLDPRAGQYGGTGLRLSAATKHPRADQGHATLMPPASWPRRLPSGMPWGYLRGERGTGSGAWPARGGRPRSVVPRIPPLGR